MKLIYNVRYPHSAKILPTEWLHEGGAVCALSNHNTIAFSSCFDLNDNNVRLLGCHIYVADLDKPWDVFKVCSHSEHISCIEWDVSGTKLVLADAAGTLLVWKMKDYLMNGWSCISSSCFQGEQFLSVAWFHTGNKICLNAEKKDCSLYNDKFSHKKFLPTLRHLGGRPKDGYVGVTATGLACASVLMPDDKLISASESLGSVRTRICVADICHAKNGDILVASSDGQFQSTIQCYKVSLRLNQDKLSISSHSLPSFYMKCFTDQPNQENYYTRVTQIKFAFREGADALILCATGQMGSCVETWELRECSTPLHRIFQTDTVPELMFRTVKWVYQATVQDNCLVTAIACPKASLFDGTSTQHYVFLAYKEHGLKCFFRESLQLVSSIDVEQCIKLREDTDGKQYYLGSLISCLQVSGRSCIVTAVDGHSQLYVFRPTNISDPGGLLSLNHAVILLEYCLVTGTDWWDVLLCLHPGMIQSVCDCLTERFHNQPETVQQLHFTHFMAMKSALYRCLNSGQNKAGDCNAFLLLNAVATAFITLLRPTDLKNQDKGPAEKLAALISSKLSEISGDLDKLLLHLETKEFIVEPQTLQSLQPLIQWVGDFSLYLLAFIPHNSQPDSPMFSLIFDIKLLSMLRELLVIIRIWGLIRPNCLPAFTKTSDNMDVLSLLYKLLTKALICCSNGEMDETLMDECCLLPSQVLIRELDLGTSCHGIASSTVFSQQIPLFLEYNTEPDHLSRYDARCQQPLQKEDVVRRIYLGAQPALNLIKQCTRCCQVSFLNLPAKSAAMKAWDQRWLRVCPCGGLWKSSPFKL